jgi:Zn-dependent protease with chaperone function
MTLVLLCLAALAIVAYSVSGALALGLTAVGNKLVRLAPGAQARLYLFAALLPLLASLAVLLAALAPSFGWIADHCAIVEDPHTHPHICADHPLVGRPASLLIGLAAVVTARFVWFTGQWIHALALGASAQRSLRRASHPSDTPDVRVLPIEEAQAFVLGLLRPTLYVTHGLTVGNERAHLAAVIAHERAHVSRSDPLRRFAAGIGLSFHLPGVARWVGRCLARSHEMAADDIAATTLGSRTQVAQALVALARGKGRIPQHAFAFSQSDIETRVVRLLEPRNRRDSPAASTLAIAAVVAVTIMARGADVVHHGVEILLGALGG